MASIAWLGTGLLGSGFVKAALGRKDTVRVWNRTAQKASPLVELGATLAHTPAEAVTGVERVHLCLSDDAAVDAILDELLKVPGFTGPVIDHTTVTPKGAEARAQRLAARGVGFLACPVFMGPGNAVEATGRMLCAGPAALVEQLAPALKAMTGDLVISGEDVRRPATIKLVGNSLIIGLTGLVSDALAIAQGGDPGLSSGEVLRFLAGYPVGTIISARGNRMAQGDYAASFELSMARKDVRLMQSTAGVLPLAVLDGLGARMDALIAQGHGAKDLGALAIETVPPKGIARPSEPTAR